MAVIIRAALASANRAYPVFSHKLGTWGAYAVAACNLASLGLLYVPTGTWSPSSVSNLALQIGSVYVWISLTAVSLLRLQSATRTRNLR